MGIFLSAEYNNLYEKTKNVKIYKAVVFKIFKLYVKIIKTF